MAATDTMSPKVKRNLWIGIGVAAVAAFIYAKVKAGSSTSTGSSSSGVGTEDYYIPSAGLSESVGPNDTVTVGSSNPVPTASTTGATGSTTTTGTTTPTNLGTLPGGSIKTGGLGYYFPGIGSQQIGPGLAVNTGLFGPSAPYTPTNVPNYGPPLLLPTGQVVELAGGYI